MIPSRFLLKKFIPLWLFVLVFLAGCSTGGYHRQSYIISQDDVPLATEEEAR